VSSTASNVSATSAVGSSPRPQTPPAAQDNSGAPFAALLDAHAAAPDTQPTPQTAAPRASAATDQPAAKFSTRGNNGSAGAAQSTTPDAQAPAAATANVNATATTPAPVASSNANASPVATQNATANQAGAAAPTDTGAALNVFAGEAAANIVTDATANAAIPDASAKTPSDNSKQNDSRGVTDASAAGAAANVQVQPIAAAVVAGTVINTPPAAAAAATPNIPVGGSATAGAQPALPPFTDTRTIASSVVGSVSSATPDASKAPAAPDANTVQTAQDVKDAALTQDVKISAAGQDAKAAAPAQDAKIAVVAQDPKVAIPAPTAKVAALAQATKPAATGKQTSSATSSDPIANADSADAGSPADATDGQTWNGSAAPQAQARADSDIIVRAQSGGGAATHVDAFATSLAAEAGASPAAQNGWNAAKAATEGLPNFGFVASQAAPTAAAATPGSAAAATVPIAGLAVTIASRAQAGSNQFDIRLDPPELGRIDVRLDVDRNGQVTSHVRVDRADTLQLLQSQQPQLERALEQAGLKTADNGLQFTLRDQSFAGQNSGGGAQPNVAQLVIPDADQPAVQATQIYSRAGLGSGVDIRV
jgi:flagellar hook-length control protein FliK